MIMIMATCYHNRVRAIFFFFKSLLEARFQISIDQVERDTSPIVRELVEFESKFEILRTHDHVQNDVYATVEPEKQQYTIEV